jgi:hypothetical protein
VTRSELEHAIRAACDVADDTEVYVLGSQAILGQFPNAPETLRQSAEADVVPKHRPERANEIDAMLGELSMASHSMLLLCPRDGSDAQSAYRTRTPATSSAGAWKVTTWRPANLRRSETKTGSSSERCSLKAWSSLID